MGDDWMTDEHREAARQGHLDMVRSVIANAPTEMLALELRRRECAVDGHDYTVIHSQGVGEPVALTCPCGGAWDVTPVRKPVETSAAADPRGPGGC